MRVKIRRAGVWQEEETTFVWQGMRLAQEKTGGGTHTYIYDPDEGYSPLARMTQRGGEEALYWFHTDINGTPLEMTDEKGQLRWSGKYGVWGRVTRQNVRDIRESAYRRWHQPLRYAGQYSDSETGLHYNTYRYYDPDSGRFTTQDPIGLAGGLNLYQYAPNPLSYIDPLGLMFLYRGMSLSEYTDLIKDGVWKTGRNSMEGKWFAESYKDAVTWGNKMGHGGDTFRIVQIDVPDDIASKMHIDPHLDGIGPARYAQLDELNDPRVRKTWSHEVSSGKC